VTTTPTITSTLPTASPTAADGTETPTATATLSAQDVVVKGQLDYEDLIMGELAAGSVDAWNVTVVGSESITVTVSPTLSENVIVSVLDADGQPIVNRQDRASAGQVELIQNINVADTDSIQIQIAADPANQVDYALMVLDEMSYNFAFQGPLEPGIQRTGSLDPDEDHFWFFSASDGENVNLRVTPNGDTDVYVELFGPDSTRIEIIDEDNSGIAETLENYSILDTGLYGIRVGEFDFGSMSYQIIIEMS
jgi:hypothetical protein